MNTACKENLAIKFRAAASLECYARHLPGLYTKWNMFNSTWIENNWQAQQPHQQQAMVPATLVVLVCAGMEWRILAGGLLSQPAPQHRRVCATLHAKRGSSTAHVSWKHNPSTPVPDLHPRSEGSVTGENSRTYRSKTSISPLQRLAFLFHNMAASWNMHVYKSRSYPCWLTTAEHHQQQQSKNTKMQRSAFLQRSPAHRWDLCHSCWSQLTEYILIHALPLPVQQSINSAGEYFLVLHGITLQQTTNTNRDKQNLARRAD